jgi:sulfur-carrier protein
MAKVKILYFAWVREQIGLTEEQVELPSEIETVVNLIDWLVGRSDAHGLAFADRSKIRCAIDQSIVAQDASIKTVNEIAFFPPVTGG